MDSISSYIKSAISNHQASALSFAQAFAQSSASQIETFWSEITAEAQAQSIAMVDHEIVKAADSAGFIIPSASSPSIPVLGFQPLKRVPGSSPGIVK